MKNINKYLFTGVIALVLVIGTLMIPETVNNKEDMEAMQFGYPMTFITQDLSAYDPPFPQKYSFSSPWENPLKISWIGFFVSYLAIFLVTFFLISRTRRCSIKNNPS